MIEEPRLPETASEHIPDSLDAALSVAFGSEPSPPKPPAEGKVDAAEAETTPPTGAEAGAVIAGRYKLLQPIGEGGMGSVWMAQQTKPVTRLVAVKLIKPGMDSNAVVARFDAER